LVLLITLTPWTRPLLMAAEAAVIGAAVLYHRLPIRKLLWRLLMLSPFVAGAALAAAFGAHGADWEPLAVRSALCLAAVIVLSQTTSVSELLGVLRDVRVPPLLVTTLALMHRYLHVLSDESGRMTRARTARTFRPGRRLAWMAAASVVGQLFVRASERAERVYDAMCARGWKA
jgi:cobalt/nickel transport system permease protein